MINFKEYILEAIQNTYIFEMAHDRKQIRNKVEGLHGQIIENWCLVKYCSLYDNDNINKNHWKNELITHLKSIYKLTLKDGNKYSKFKLIYTILIEEYEITTAKKIEQEIYRKFKKENIILQKDICEVWE